MQPDQLICNGKYRLIRPLGKGEYGQVWLAEERDSRASVALKVARAGDEQAQRFDYEIRLNRSLDHPYLLGANTVEKVGKTRYLVLPYAAGESLKERLEKGPLPVEEAVRIAINIAAALGYLHKKDIIHRDVHPGNVLFTKEGVVKLADLGVAQSKESGTPFYGSGRDVQPGNPLYLPPEAFAKEGHQLLPLYPTADVYMLGAVLWEMLTGRLYYQTRGKPLRSLCPQAPDWQEELLARMLAEQPNERPGDGQEVANLLQDGIKQDIARQEEARQKEEQAQRVAKEQALSLAEQRSEEINRLKGEAQSALGREDWNRADKLASELAGKGDEGKGAAASLQEQISQARQAEITRLQREAEAALARKDWGQAKRLIAQLENLDADGRVTADRLRKRLPKRRLPGWAWVIGGGLIVMAIIIGRLVGSSAVALFPTRASTNTPPPTIISTNMPTPTRTLFLTITPLPTKIIGVTPILNEIPFPNLAGSWWVSPEATYGRFFFTISWENNEYVIKSCGNSSFTMSITFHSWDGNRLGWTCAAYLETGIHLFHFITVSMDGDSLLVFYTHTYPSGNTRSSNYLAHKY